MCMRIQSKSQKRTFVRKYESTSEVLSYESTSVLSCALTRRRSVERCETSSRCCLYEGTKYLRRYFRKYFRTFEGIERKYEDG